jgi:hypothetical protein
MMAEQSQHQVVASVPSPAVADAAADAGLEGLVSEVPDDPTNKLQWQPYGVCLKARANTSPEWLCRLGTACINALDCVISSCSDVNTVSNAVDVWNSNDDYDRSNTLLRLLDAAVDEQDVEPGFADLCVSTF